jgi:hypothetical protein
MPLHRFFSEQDSRLRQIRADRFARIAQALVQRRRQNAVQTAAYRYHLYRATPRRNTSSRNVRDWYNHYPVDSYRHNRRRHRYGVRNALASRFRRISRR